MTSLRLSVAFQASTSDISSTVPKITECEPLRSRSSQTQTCGPVLRSFWRTYPNWYRLRSNIGVPPLCLSPKGGSQSLVPSHPTVQLTDVEIPTPEAEEHKFAHPLSEPALPSRRRYKSSI